MAVFNPLAFKPTQVTLVTLIVYLAFFVTLIVFHENVPSTPSSPTPYSGINLTEAWLDLQELSNGYHPYNSRRNGDVRNWLLRRIEGLLDANGAVYLTQGTADADDYLGNGLPITSFEHQRAPGSVVIFNDITSNYSSNTPTAVGADGRKRGISTYFEGDNIIVYVRGSEDEDAEWWKYAARSKSHGKGGVMVNAHFDSVSTGFGATDDGMGVITALQLVKYFTNPENIPKKGFVALFNNGEEDGLYGANAFLQHPMASFVHTFLNLEGAGAGGRATLFRSTDTEVTRAYQQSPHPFGSVVSSDGFALGLIRSETDYVVFREAGFRGLDVAFWEPRARYHTDEDDAAHASRESLWHMLSASVETVNYLTSDTSSTFDGPRGDDDRTKVRNGDGSDGVWFDLFGTVFAVFQLRTLFAWSLTILIAGPIILIAVSYLLVKSDRYYFFAGTIKSYDDHESVSLDGWKGFFRYPVTFLVSGGIATGFAFLMRKVNPMIVYSSQYTVWAMFLSLYFVVFWFIMAGCNSVRPSALHRGYALVWLFVLGWMALVAATVFEDRYKISAGYLAVFYTAALFIATLITHLEMFALPTKASVVKSARDIEDTREGLHAVSNSEDTAGQNDGTADDADPDENTPLVGGGNGRASGFATFASRYRQFIPSMMDGANDEREAKGAAFFGSEQDWSGKLPSWTWSLQFLLLGPFIFIIVGQVGLLIVTAVNQTGTDGSPLLVPYLAVMVFSILLLLPVTPFIHRITAFLPTLLFLIFVGTLIYNLVAFPFSADNRYKAYFQQTVDLDTGINQVVLAGLEEYIRPIIAELPSASGQSLNCTLSTSFRAGLTFCSWNGLAPAVVDNFVAGAPPETGFSDWISTNVTREIGQNKATFNISGLETRACKILFDDPFSEFKVRGGVKPERRWDEIPETGFDQIKLWHRDFDREWVVDVEWAVSEGHSAGDEGRSGRVVCLWSDHNKPGVIPALDEAQRFAPIWTSIVKMSDGLVEGSKAFNV